jgi:hypothetical protein
MNSLTKVTRTAIGLAGLSLMVCCIREPELHLFDVEDIDITLPVVNIELDAYWDYENAYGLQYNWREEWSYGWDEEDERLFGPIGYSEPSTYLLRRYFTGTAPRVPHHSVLANTIRGKSFRSSYNIGFWDILVWNDIITPDNVQSLNFDEQSSLDYVTAFTNQTMIPTRYNEPKYTHSFYQPEELFSAYDQGLEISADLEGFVYDPVNNIYVKKLDMVLEPITYIYLTQVILHNNHNKVTGTDGQGNLSGFGRTTVINSGVTGSDYVTVYYNNRFKRDCRRDSGLVDIIGGRLLTFGIVGQNANRIKRREDVTDTIPHYLDVTMLFNNGADSTFVFDVTDQVRRRWKGGVITVELDMDTVRVPTRRGGSAFDAVVKDFEEVTHEFDM